MSQDDGGSDGVMRERERKLLGTGYVWGIEEDRIEMRLVVLRDVMDVGLGE